MNLKFRWAVQPVPRFCVGQAVEADVYHDDEHEECCGPRTIHGRVVSRSYGVDNVVWDDDWAYTIRETGSGVLHYEVPEFDVCRASETPAGWEPKESK